MEHLIKFRISCYQSAGKKFIFNPKFLRDSIITNNKLSFYASQLHFASEFYTSLFQKNIPKGDRLNFLQHAKFILTFN